MQEEKVQKLSEGYDFIEEAVSMTSVPLDYQSTNEVIISESESTKHQYKILGKLKGCFAPVGGFSRNNRYYPPSHWVEILKNPEIQRRLAGREMFGMISHEDARVGDAQIKEGLVSHIVTVLDIREDINGKPFLYGEMEILDTPAGRILKAMHEGGAGLYVSSRGAGKLLDTPGQTYKTVSPQFYLECFDVVSRAGFVEAKPVFEQVTESKEVSESAKPVSFEEHKRAEDIKTEQYKKATKDLINADGSLKVKKEATNEEVETLKAQIQQLAGIVEKVVDSLYEKDEEIQENSDLKKSAILATLGVLSEANLSEETLEEVIDLIKRGIN